MIGILALFLAAIWMLRDEKDETRPLLVFALALNLFYGFALKAVMGKEDGLLPWKYDSFLLHVDALLGVSAASIAVPLQGFWRVPLGVAYQLLVPMMICWFLVVRDRNQRAALVLAYIAEMITGPLLYAILPACGPIYSLGTEWLHPSIGTAHVVRLTGMPNAFPSLHLATAMVFVLFARGKLWRAVSMTFFLATIMATLSTGEHYVVDLIAGLAFGCFAANAGHRRMRATLLYLGISVSLSLAIRFACQLLSSHPGMLRFAAILTVASATWAVLYEWRSKAVAVPGRSNAGPGVRCVTPIEVAR